MAAAEIGVKERERGQKLYGEGVGFTLPLNVKGGAGNYRTFEDDWVAV
ncbi:MAG: hypothetical protein M3444_00660 [Acidobacteriota bacterium]|nr:hypothetical protein [Acidobacteriota bacterium]MDQ5835200.1 hypothetical protein [Acidobacteriota bacterium]